MADLPPAGAAQPPKWTELNDLCSKVTKYKAAEISKIINWFCWIIIICLDKISHIFVFLECASEVNCKSVAIVEKSIHPTNVVWVNSTDIYKKFDNSDFFANFEMLAVLYTFVLKSLPDEPT